MLPVFDLYNFSTQHPKAKIISPVLWLHGTPIGKPSEVMMTMTTLMANHTPPSTPHQQWTSLSLPQPGRYWKHQNLMFGATTTTVLTIWNFYVHAPPRFPKPSNCHCCWPPVNDDDWHLHPKEYTTMAPNPSFAQEWNDFNDEFNDFYMNLLTSTMNLLPLPLILSHMMQAPSALTSTSMSMMTNQQMTVIPMQSNIMYSRS